MSKMVDFTNSSLTNLLQTLSDKGAAAEMEHTDPECEGHDPQMLLLKNHKAIKNINHSLMKLVSVQQESIIIGRNVP